MKRELLTMELPLQMGEAAGEWKQLTEREPRAEGD